MGGVNITFSSDFPGFPRRDGTFVAYLIFAFFLTFMGEDINQFIAIELW